MIPALKWVMRSSFLTSGLITALVLLPPSILAQSEPVATRPVHTPPPIDTVSGDTVVILADQPRRPNCWRAQPRPACAAFFVTDIGIEVPLRSTRTADPAAGHRKVDFPTRVVWTFGFMGTRGRHSTGPAISITTEEVQNTFAPNIYEWRYRNWLAGSPAIDVGLGYKVNEVWEQGVGLVGARGITAMLGYTPTRYIGLSARGDFVRSPSRNHRAVLVGVQSTRLSELMIKHLFIGVIRALLASIGIELEEE